jgi:hypothetical protein
MTRPIQYHKAEIEYRACCASAHPDILGADHVQ